MLRFFIFALFLFLSTNVCAANPYKSEAIAQRRARIMRNGNIQNVYPKPFNVRWILLNNRAYMVINWGSNNGTRYNN